MKNYYLTLFFLSIMMFTACNDAGEDDNGPDESIEDFTEVGSISIGGEGAAEISAFDPLTKKLFVVNNEADSKIDVLDLSDPTFPVISGNIPVSNYGGGVNSVAVKNGMLAAAIEANTAQENGSVVVFSTEDHTELKVVTVGALPDMVTFTPDGAYILAANEGEPNADYSVDPEGSVAIISTIDFSVKIAGFSAFESKIASLKADGYRVFGPNATLSQDTEPEYIAVSDDSKTAYVSLQENNGIAIVDVVSGTISDIVPLGFKDHSVAGNEMDPSDRDDVIAFKPVPTFGIYQPDALATFTSGGATYIITANEGDAREYDTYVEEARVEDLELDPNVFTDSELQNEENLGRLTITTTLGDANGDGLYEELYSFGTRSFSIWTSTGELYYDSGSALERDLVTNLSGAYDEGRSDNKGVEPEGVTVGMVGGRTIAFVGLERVDAVSLYDISNPAAPEFIAVFETGDAPEGLVFVPHTESPNGYSMLIVSSEDDGQVKIYQSKQVLD
ncbi:MAG: choice-of-anchor I family protein [Cyclobacteriaceae bacterium]